MEIFVFNEQCDYLINDDEVRRIVHETLLIEKVSCDEVSIHFVTNEQMCLLHEEYFNDPTPTDCISFPIDTDDAEPYRILGEVFICPFVAQCYINQHGGDLRKEVYLYIVHGLLHLLGYDDISEKDRKVMRAAEMRIMEQISIA